MQIKIRLIAISYNQTYSVASALFRYRK